MSNVAQFAGQNDSSLEHCFTNIFALTDFSGIQYRKYTLKSEKEQRNLLGDPILKSYVNCQKNSVLSAWVRSKRESTDKRDPCAFSKFGKELWVFWYGSVEFPNADSCILPELHEVDRGNWRQGLSYETRTILFRALHNVVERCLLNKGFVRLGKWFVQPYKHNCSNDYAQYSVGFSFFLHGESTVCATLDLRQHPTVRRISLHHVNYCATHRTTIPVVLSPYGISAELVGISQIMKNDEEVMKELEEWTDFYPLKSNNQDGNGENECIGLPQFSTHALHGGRNQGHKYSGAAKDKRVVTEVTSKGSDSTPLFVDVITGGFRMHYPSCFVLLPESDQTISPSAVPSHDKTSAKSSHDPRISIHPASYAVPSKCDFGAVSAAQESRSSNLWRNRKNPSYVGRPSSLGLLVSKGVLRSNLFFDAQRICLADKAIRLSLHHRVSLPLCLSCTYSAHPHKSSDATRTVHVASGLKVTSSTQLSPRNQGDRCSCQCKRPSTPHDSTDCGLFHQNGKGLRCALRSIIHHAEEINGCTGGLVPSNIFAVAHDPSMPTLSPQQPTSNPLLGTCWNKGFSDASIQRSSKVDHSRVIPLASKAIVPPSLSFVSVVPQFNAVGADLEESLSVSCSDQKLPNGLVEVEDKLCRTHGHSRPQSPLPPIQMKNHYSKNTWLTKLVHEECRTVDFSRKRPALVLNPADTPDLDPNYLEYPSSVSLPKMDVAEAVPCVTTNYHTVAKRPRSSWKWHFDEFQENSPDEPSFESLTVQPNFPCLSPDHDTTPMTPEIALDGSDLDVCEEYGDGFTSSADVVPCQTNTLLANLSTAQSRALNLLPHKGVSLASSTGSGHLGPAELALMLPTPPSHDAPQPSPVDGVTLASISGNNCRPTISVSNGSTANSPVYSVQVSGLACSNENDVSSVEPACIGSSSLQQQPWSSPHMHLLSLAKHSCVHIYNFSTLDPNQDWSFVRPRSALLGIESSYQLNCKDWYLSTDIPCTNLAFDHRALRPKLSFTHSSMDVSGLSAVVTRTTNSPSSNLYGSLQTQSGSLSPNTLTSPTDPREAILNKSKPPTPYSLHHSSVVSEGVRAPGSALILGSANSCISSEDPSERLHNLVESNGIMLNVVLSDSLLNLFKDHNFDSCNICECTSSVLGSEIDLYLSSAAPFLHNSMGKTHRSSLGSVTGSGGNAFGSHDLVNGVGFGLNNDCKCGFSAVMNQKYVVNGNLFYEDEVEVMNLRLLSDHIVDHPKVYSFPPMYRRQLILSGGPSSSVSNQRVMLLKQMVQGVYEEFAVRQLMDFIHCLNLSCPVLSVKENMLEYDDSCTLVTAALYESSQSGSKSSVDSHAQVHPSYIMKAQSKIPENHNDQIRLLATMRPWLQEAISSTRLLESNYTVDGPLSWKAFHQLAGRGSDETCKPQPVPQLRVGSSDQEDLLISPFAVRDWDRLGLSPLSSPKQLAYAVVLPVDLTDDYNSTCSPLAYFGFNTANCVSGLSDPPFKRNSHVSVQCGKHFASLLTRFLKEISLTYENCRLGQHLPYQRPDLNDPETGFITIDCADKTIPIDEFSLSPELTSKLSIELESFGCSPETFLHSLQLYTCCAVQRTVENFKEKGISIPSRVPTHVSSSNRTVPNEVFSSLSLPRPNERSIKPSKCILGNSSTNPRNGQGPLTSSFDTSSWNSSDDTYLVIYLVNPFSQICSTNVDLVRVVTQFFLECARKLVSSLPEAWKPRTNIQLLSLDHVISDYSPRLQSMALALYSSVTRYIEPSLINANRTLTGIGPAAEKEAVSSERESFHRRCINAPPYVLGSPNDSGLWDIPPSDPFYRSSVLFVAYCLSQDQQWLMASFTDEHGSLLDQTVINISVPTSFFNDIESRKAQSEDIPVRNNGDKMAHYISPRRIGLIRLWDYIISFLSRTANPWRLVIGRIGRLGHGELKGWNGLLGRKSLQDANKFFRERCSVCCASAAVPSQISGVTGAAKATLNLVNCSGGANSCTHELPNLISACLVSLEPQSTFRVYSGLGVPPDDAWAVGG